MTIAQPESDPFRRLRAVSRVMTIAVAVGMAALVVLAVMVFLVPVVTKATIIPEIMPFGITEISPRARLLGLLVLCLPLAVFLYGLNEMRLLFAQYATGDVLTVGAAHRLKLIAWATVIGAVLRAPTRAGLYLALSIDQMDLPPRLPVRINAADFTFLLFGLLLLAVAWVMAEAARIAEDHRQII